MKIFTTILTCVSVFIALSFSGNAHAARNVILIIGDGMGPQQLGLLSLYTRFGTNDYVAYTERISHDGESGFLLTYPADYLVTDSGASGTQIASGRPALPRVVGVTAEGEPAYTVADAARTAGKSVGLISDTRITHATPACFGAHWPKRDDENRIAKQMLENGAEVMLSGGARHWLPVACTDSTSRVYEKYSTRIGDAWKITSKRDDSRNLLDCAERKGYETALTKKELENTHGPKVIGLFASSAMPHAIEERRNVKNPTNAIPSLKQMTAIALKHLAKNTNGFFLMIEAGQIDWACHLNDAGHLLYEMMRLNDVIEEAYTFAAEHDDTLIIVTSDHETGGFSINYSPQNPPEAVAFPGNMYTNQTFDPGYDYRSPVLIEKLAQQKKPLAEVVNDFLSLPETERIPALLASMVTTNTGFTLSVRDATDILTFVPNPEYAPGKSGHGPATHPLISDYSVFYNLDTLHRITALIARKLAPQTGISWAGGAHSHTPVPVIAYGPEKDTEKFKGIHHTTDFGNSLIRCVEK